MPGGIPAWWPSDKPFIISDCKAGMKLIPDNSIDAIVTDPPYELGFMGKAWDSTGIAYDVDVWKECLRILKPGGHLLSFGGSRTYHRMACAIEDAGFEVRDMIEYMYGSGFPKSLNVQKQLVKKFKYEIGYMVVYELNGNTEGTKTVSKYYLRPMLETDISQEKSITAPEGEVLQPVMSQQGVSEHWKETDPIQFPRGGTKSCLERWNYIKTTKGELQGCKVCALSERIYLDGEERWVCNGTPFSYGTSDWKAAGTVRSCPSYQPQPIGQQQGQFDAVLKQYRTQEIRRIDEYFDGIGTALKPAHEPICMARKPIEKGLTIAENCLKWNVGGLAIDECRVQTNEVIHVSGDKKHLQKWKEQDGRSERDKDEIINTPYDHNNGRFPANLIHDGSAEVLAVFPNETARFFYCAKASKSERDEGCGGLEAKRESDRELDDGVGGDNPRNRTNTPSRNHHPTVKPIALIEYLIKLISREGQIVLDPFLGSGTTIKAAQGIKRIGIGFEMNPEYAEIIDARVIPRGPLDTFGIATSISERE